MAKKQSVAASAESKLEEFAEDLGRLLGQARGKAESWIGQRNAIAEHLKGVRDTATQLLAQLGIAEAPRQQVPVGASTPKRGPGRPRKVKRTMSPEARAKISAAQKARWAKQKRA